FAARVEDAVVGEGHDVAVAVSDGLQAGKLVVAVLRAVGRRQSVDIRVVDAAQSADEAASADLRVVHFELVVHPRIADEGGANDGRPTLASPVTPRMSPWVLIRPFVSWAKMRMT